MASDRCTLSCWSPEPVAPVAAASTPAETASTPVSGRMPKVITRRTEPSFAMLVKSRRMKSR